MTHGPYIDAGSELDPVHPVELPEPARATGLTTAEVAERVARGEVNDVPVRSSRSTAEIVRANVFTRFNAIIGVLWVIMMFVAPIQDSLFGFVIIANTGIGIFQEYRAKKTLDGLAVIGEAKPTVRRDGVPGEISTSELVLGDLIELGPGDKVVVDGETVEADGLEIDESLLTGEADPVHKKPGDPMMSGSFVAAGGGAFTATRVGREAYAAQLAEEASRFTLVHSELRSGISTILKYVTWMMVPTAAGLVVSALVHERHDIKDSIARTIGGIIPMIPEGLVLLTSVAFAIGVIRLARQQCLVQELPAIEGLARVDVVCLDKTGTLTEGGMNVTGLRMLGGADEAYIGRVLGALGASDPRPNASLQAIIDSYPDTMRLALHPGAALLVGAQVQRCRVRRERRGDLHLAARRARCAAARARPGAPGDRAAQPGGPAGAVARAGRGRSGRRRGGRGRPSGGAGGAGAAAAARSR